MKAALLAAVLLVATATLAQQTPTPQQDQPVASPADTASAAPQPGHPLDPADVDILTGKNKPEGRRGYAQPYYSVSPYGYSGSSGYRGMNRSFGLLNRRTPFGFFGSGSGLVFFGRGLFTPAPVFIFRR